MKNRKVFSEKKHSCSLVFPEMAYNTFHLLNIKHLYYPKPLKHGNIQILYLYASGEFAYLISTSFYALNM